MVTLRISRRAFIAATAATTLSLAHRGSAEDASASYIDAHSHIWTRDIAKYPLAEGKTLADLKPASFTAEELLKLANKNRVGKVVLIQHRPLHGYDNSYIIDAVAKHPKNFRAVGMLPYDHDNPADEMKRLHKLGVTGFRITPRKPDQEWLGGAVEKMWKTAASTRQNICPLINPPQLAALDGMCARHPDTPVVIDHFGRVGITGEIRESDLTQLCDLAKHKNVKVKISAYYALGKKKPPYTDLGPMIRRLLHAFGPNRLMWASDSPYETAYADSINLIRERLDFLTDNDKSWLLSKTAEQTFFAS